LPHLQKCLYEIKVDEHRIGFATCINERGNKYFLVPLHVSSFKNSMLHIENKVINLNDVDNWLKPPEIGYTSTKSVYNDVTVKYYLKKQIVNQCHGHSCAYIDYVPQDYESMALYRPFEKKFLITKNFQKNYTSVTTDPGDCGLPYFGFRKGIWFIYALHIASGNQATHNIGYYLPSTYLPVSKISKNTLDFIFTKDSRSIYTLPHIYPWKITGPSLISQWSRL
jgi:hypothetical protein